MKILLFAFLLAQSEPRPCPATLLDVNSASRTQLIAVEGMTGEVADKIIAGRPYSSLNAVHPMVPKEVWDKSILALCFDRFNIVSGNKIESVRQQSPRPPSTPRPLPPSFIPPL